MQKQELVHVYICTCTASSPNIFHHAALYVTYKRYSPQIDPHSFSWTVGRFEYPLPRENPSEMHVPDDSSPFNTALIL